MAVPRCHAMAYALTPLLFVAVTIPSWANEPSSLALLNEADLLADIPRVQSASRLSQTLAEAPASMTLIDRQMIDASGAQEISDLFRLVPGFQAYHVNGHKFGVTAHGLGETYPGRLEVMIDGRSVYLPMMASVDWRSLGVGLHDIDYIEVVRGSNVPAYGSNAFLGAINIITRTALTDRGSRISVQRGSQDQAQLELNHNASWGQQNVRVSAGYLQHDGFGVGDEGQGGYVNVQTLYTPTLTDSIDLRLGVTQGQAGIGADYSAIWERDYQSHYQVLGWTRDLYDAGELRIQLYHNYFKAKMERTPLSEIFGAPTLAFLGLADEPAARDLEEGSTERYDLELQHQRHLASRVRAVWGAGVRQDRGQSELLFNNHRWVDETLWRLFGNLEWRASQQATWNLGAMTEHHEAIGSKTSPRLALIYQLHPRHSLRASYTHAYRMPSLLESQQDSRRKHSNGTVLLWLRNADPNLQPEQNRTLELGYLGQVAALNLDIDLKLFHEEVDDGIGQVKNDYSEKGKIPGIDRTTNSNNLAWRSQGLEAQLKVRPTLDSLVALQYAYQDLEGQARGGDLNPGDASLNGQAPRHSLSLLGSYQFASRWRASLTYYQQSATGFTGGSEVDSYQRLDTRLAKTFVHAHTDSQVAFVVQNLLNDGYTEFQHRNQFDRRAYLSLSLHFL